MSSNDTAGKLRALSMMEDAAEGLLQMQFQNLEASGLDPRTYFLVKIAALVALDAAPASFVWNVAMAREAGVSDDEVLGVLLALAPTVGLAKIVSTAPEVGLALGYDLDDEE
jgi:4-carboxymuconolactone decarboxylase